MKIPSKPKKVLVLGSGALKIGEAGEFDYSGSQAIKALKEEKIKTVLVNPNIATVQTSEFLADEIYFLPVTEYFAAKVIAKERPDGILLAFGGQTALNCGLALQKKGVLKKYGVRVLGTPISAIELTEDRQKFADHLRKIGIPTPLSGAAQTLPQALKIAQKLSYPVMVRAAFALGGQKSGVARNPKQLKDLASGALAVSPQILVEKYLHHYKEIEYEVVRDGFNNCVTVCNMENMDPLGIHTGDSIVVAPSQTLDNLEYHALRQASIKIVQSLGIVGECNVQFALNPNPRSFPPPRWGRLGGGDGFGSHLIPPLSSPSRGGDEVDGKIDFQVIEVNARLSRSSALASKATGYPLAYVAAKLALGKKLLEVQNRVTRVTQSFFEPALDYVAVKMPRWDLEKFPKALQQIGSAMKSVGEVMAIGRSFEEALQKAVRMLNGFTESVTDDLPRLPPASTNRGERGKAGGLPKKLNQLIKLLQVPTPKRIFALAEALKRGMEIAWIYKLTGIDPWFLYRLKNIVEAEKKFVRKPRLTTENLWRLKRLGFSDKKIGRLAGKTELEIRRWRQDHKILPSVFQIDTLAGEAPAKTNYLYLTYHGGHNDVSKLSKKSVVVLGSGPYHIGSSVEFDWSCVFAARGLSKYGRRSIIINCNPETVSTDYDMSDRLYFENLSFETVADICDFEQPEGAIISVGGQRPNNLAKPLHSYGVKILGTSAADIDRAEDRNKFSALLDRLKIPQPQWRSFTTMAEAAGFARRVKYPVLVRPSYVLSGSAMSVCYSQKQLEYYIQKATVLNADYPVTISKFMLNAKEIELDAVAQNGRILVHALAEHVENAGVHSGDATIVYPAQKVYTATEQQILKIVRALCKNLNITGPVNIQFLVKENKVFVIETNLRASRTFPLLSKATGVNFAEKIVAALFQQGKKIIIKYPEHVVVKSPQFSFSRLSGADPVLNVEMASTGEAACFGDTYEEALFKAILSTSNFSAKKSVLVSLGGAVSKQKFLESAKELDDLGYKIFATDTTAEFLAGYGIKSSIVGKAYERARLSAVNMIEQKKVAFVVNLTERDIRQEKKFQAHLKDGFLIRRASVDNNIPLFTDLQLAKAFISALGLYQLKGLAIKSYREYLKN